MQSELTIDALAREIRRVDGNHSLGAGALAEALMPFLTAALSAEQTQPVAVKALELATRLRETTEAMAHAASVDMGLWDRHSTTCLQAAAALVDVPAEPVAKQWCAYEDGHQHTSWYPEGYGDRAGWGALAKRNPAKYQIVTRDLFASPPLSREGEDTAEVERLRKALTKVAEEAAVANDVIRLNRDGGGNGRVKVATAMHRIAGFADAALAATRSGSAINATGVSNDG